MKPPFAERRISFKTRYRSHQIRKITPDTPSPETELILEYKTFQIFDELLGKSSVIVLL